MKIKIVEVLKKFDSVKMKNGGNVYAFGVKALVDGKEEFARISTFSDKVVIEKNVELEENVNCREIKVNNWNENGKQMKNYQIYAIKKEFKKFENRKKSKEDYEKAIQFSFEKAKELCKDIEDNNLVWSYFSAILKGAEYVDFTEKPTSQKIDDTFGGGVNESL